MSQPPSVRIAVITGASRGIGRSAALHLSRAGVGVIGTYRDPATDVAALQRGADADGAAIAMLPLDVADPSGFAAFAGAVRAAARGTFGRDSVDHLVNNAGSGLSKPYAETTETELDRMLTEHVKAPYLLTQALLPVLTDGGSVLNISSCLTRLSHAGSSAYALAKGAVEVLTRYQAVELGARRIRVNAARVGVVATDFRGGAVRDTPGVRDTLAGAIALGRVPDADDIGRTVPALLSADPLGWADGAIIELSGGQSL